MSKRTKKDNPTTKSIQHSAAVPSNGTAEKRNAKKAAVLGTEKKGRMPLIIVAVCAALVLSGAVFIVAQNKSDFAPVAGSSTSAGNTVSQVSFPVSLFEDGKARHFKHTDGNFTITYFILKSSDGIIRAAYDACDVCWPAGKGYYQEGDYMVCRNCGRKFASVLVNEVKGGCNPAPLMRTIVNDQVVIQVKDILDGKPYFNFAGKA